MNTGIVKKLALAGAGALLLAVAGCAAPLSEAPAYTVAAYQPGQAVPQADVVTITRAQFDGLGQDGAELLERLALGTVVYIAGGDGDTPAPEDGVQIGTALTAAGDQVQAQQVYALWEEGGALPEDLWRTAWTRPCWPRAVPDSWRARGQRAPPPGAPAP